MDEIHGGWSFDTIQHFLYALSINSKADCIGAHPLSLQTPGGEITTVAVNCLRQACALARFN